MILIIREVALHCVSGGGDGEPMVDVVHRGIYTGKEEGSVVAKSH